MKMEKKMGSNSDLSAIGKRIAEQRQKNKLTQAKLATRVSVSREMINYWENGKRDIKTENIVQLAEALNTTCDYLLRGVESKNHDISKLTSDYKEKMTMTVEEMANELGICRPVAYELIKRDGFPAIRISERRIIIPVEALRDWLNKNAGVGGV